jgi:hypothetical protein
MKLQRAEGSRNIVSENFMTLPLHRPHTRTKLKGIIEIHEKIRAENVNETMKRLYR